MSGIGAVNGVSEGVFAPKKTATRAMAAQILYNILKADGKIE